MLPNIAQHGSTTVRHLLPFTKWILEPTLGLCKVEIAFMAKTITRQMALQWDPTTFSDYDPKKLPGTEIHVETT